MLKLKRKTAELLKSAIDKRLVSIKQLRADGEAALAKLKQREIDLDSANGGRLDCKKEISSLQSELSNLTVKISEMKEKREFSLQHLLKRWQKVLLIISQISE